MKKSEIFKSVLETVSECTEVDAAEICSNVRTDDVVVARCLVAVCCADYGLSHKHIQEYLHLRSHSSIRYYLNMYESRRQTDKHFRHIAACIGHELDKSMPATGL